jgi:hypothetical protein
MKKYSFVWKQQYLPEKNLDADLVEASKFTGGKKF